MVTSGSGRPRATSTSPTSTFTLFAHVADLERLDLPDFVSVGIFDGTTPVYSAAGDVVDGDFDVTIVP